MSIRIKAQLIFSVVTVFAIIFSGIVIYQMNEIKDLTKEINDLNEEIRFNKDLQLEVSIMWQFLTDASLTKSRTSLEKESGLNYRSAISNAAHLSQFGSSYKKFEGDIRTAYQTGLMMFDAYNQNPELGNLKMAEFDSLCSGLINSLTIKITELSRLNSQKTKLIYLESDNSILRTKLLAAGILILGLFIAFISTSGIASSLKKLEAASAKIEEGDFDVSVDIRSKDELGRLARTFNSMARNLSRTKRELEDDISKRKIAEDELRRSNERFSKIFYTSRDSICIGRLSDGAYIEANEGFTLLTGYKKEEVSGNTSLGMNIWANPEERVRFVKELESCGYVHNLEVNFRRKDNQIRTGLLSAAIIELENEKSLITITRDITERIKAEEELKEAKRNAEKADRLKSEFLAQVSHEIRTPVNTILSYTSLIREEFPKTDDNELLNLSFSAIDSAGRRIIRTIGLLIGMAEVQSGSFELSVKPVDLKPLLEKIYLDYRNTILEKGLSFEIFSQCGEEVFVTADEYTLIQIFDNIIGNAVKFTDRGSVNISIQKENSDLLVTISDTGIGISEQYIPTLFTPFSQEEQGYTRRYEGNGLGLALVKKYCEMNRIEISVKSEKNTGTSFSLLFAESAGAEEYKGEQ